MNQPKAYLKFIDPSQRDEKNKYSLYEYVKGTGDMSIYRKGNVVNKKTVFDGMTVQAEMPLSSLKHMIHRGQKCDEYDSLDELEGELFMEAFEDF
jgi:hypothetical protein